MGRRGRVVNVVRKLVPPRSGGVVVGLAVIVACAAGLVVARRLGSESSPDLDVTGRRTAPATTGQSGSGPLQQPGPGDLPAASHSPSGFTQASAQTTGGDNTVIVFGLFTNDRMVAVSMDNLLLAVAHPNESAFPANAVSATTGSAIATGRVGDAVVVAATDQAQLVRLTRDLKQRDTLTVSDAIGSGDLTLSYGSVVPVGGGDVDVTVAFDSKVAVLRVNVPSWKIVTSKVYDDRFAGTPQACLLGATLQLVLVSTGHVDYLDPISLERLWTVAPGGTPSGAACIGQNVVVTNFDQGTASVLDGTRVVKTFAYEGQGTDKVIAAPDLGAVFLTEPENGTVIRCAIPSGRCTTGPRVGSKPTDMTLVGDRLIVAVEGDKSLALVNARSLALIGVARVPDTPRTLLSFRP
jgi:hypothetical protein